MLNVGGAEDDGAAHLAADPVLARFPQDGLLAHRKDRSSKIARHDVSRHPVGHRCARLARLALGLGGRAQAIRRLRFLSAEQCFKPLEQEVGALRRRSALLSVEQRLEPAAQARDSRRTFYFCDIGGLDEGMVIRRQRRGGQRNQATGGHDIMAAPGAAARGVRIRAIGSGSHCSLSYSDW